MFGSLTIDYENTRYNYRLYSVLWLVLAVDVWGYKIEEETIQEVL
jgi:hypothetical protein